LLDSRAGANANAPWVLGEVFDWLPPRSTENDVTTYQILTGFDGNLPFKGPVTIKLMAMSFRSPNFFTSRPIGPPWTNAPMIPQYMKRVLATEIASGGLMPRLKLRAMTSPRVSSKVVKQKVARAGLKRLDEVATPSVNKHVIERLRTRSKERADAAWERLGGEDETPSQAYARLRLQMIESE
jgi:hypothetical protein